ARHFGSERVHRKPAAARHAHQALPGSHGLAARLARAERLESRKPNHEGRTCAAEKAAAAYSIQPRSKSVHHMPPPRRWRNGSLRISRVTTVARVSFVPAARLSR